jgi:hypothetical protein
MSKACVPGGQVPLRTLPLTSRSRPDQRECGSWSVAYLAILTFKARNGAARHYPALLPLRPVQRAFESCKDPSTGLCTVLEARCAGPVR